MKVERAVSILYITAMLGGGCGRKSATAPVDETHLPPHVVEVFPAARATGVPYTTAIWARFGEPLDSATVSNTTVFLKLDTRRIPMRLTLADSARQVVIEPLVPLALRRTHTVEFSPSVRTAAGSGFGKTYSWQFTTVGVHRIETPDPADGTIGESPVAPMLWAPTDPSVGPLEYQVFLGPDSAAVADESAPVITLHVPYHLPTSRWDLAATVYWKVRVRNLETGEQELGPVWRFHTAAADAPTVAMELPPLDSGSWNGRRWTCPDILTNPNTTGVVRFDLTRVDPGLVLADAVVLIPSSTNIVSQNPRLWALVTDWFPCDARYFGYPPVLWFGLFGYLAEGFKDPNGYMNLGSPLFAAEVQARIRGHREFFGYALTSEQNVNYRLSGAWLRLTYYAPGATSAHSGARPGNARAARAARPEARSDR